MRQRVWFAGIIVFGLVAGSIYLVHLRSATTRSTPVPALAPTTTKNQYVDPAICADCHPKISETYYRTGMGRSFGRPVTATAVGDPKKPVTFYHKPSDSYFTNIERDGKFFQRRYQIGFDGKETNNIEKEIDFVMGSGNHARAYLHRTRRNTLIELPLGWYAEKEGLWAMSPGYDRPDHPGFTRAVTDGCMFCHNGIPDISPASSALRVEPMFSGRIPEGIDCQRCHGPGGAHVKLAETGDAAVDDIRKAIVNPAKLSPDRQMEVCMQCHLQTTSSRLPNSIVRYDREPFSYQPGEPLSNFMLHFDHAPGSGREDKFEIAGAVYRLRRSACFQKSEGALQCTTCHDPHDIPRGEEATSHYTSVCRGCHESAVKQLADSGKHPRADKCISCHMPKRRTDDVVHAVMTDHYIQRRKPARDLLAPIAERHETENSYYGEVVLYYPQTLPEGADRDLYLAVAQVSHKTNLTKGIQNLSAAIEKYRPERIEFYVQLADAWKDSGQIANAVPLYEEAARRNPQSLLALQRLGFVLRELGQLPRAAEILKQALAVDTGDAASWHQLGLVYLAQGSASDALSAFQKAVELDPDMSETHNSVGGLFLESGNFSRAEPAFREAIRIMPDYAEAHSNLASVLASTNRLREARYHFETAIRLKPDYVAARFNYGIALAKSGDVAGAIPQFRKVALSSDQALRDRAIQILQQLGQR